MKHITFLSKKVYICLTVIYTVDNIQVMELQDEKGERMGKRTKIAAAVAGFAVISTIGLLVLNPDRPDVNETVTMLDDSLLRTADEIEEATKARSVEMIEQILEKQEFSSEEEKEKVRNELMHGMGIEMSDEVSGGTER